MKIASKLSTGLVGLVIGGTLVPAVASAAPSAPAGFAITTFAAAPQTMPATTGADDITNLSDDVFVGWQNGVGPKGEPNSTTGQATSLLVEYSASGRQVGSWALPGKIDGLGSDPAEHRVIASVNEDGNSSLYTITPSAPSGQQVRHYTYSPAPDSASTGGPFTGGGTDTVTVFRGHVYLTASNPMSTGATAVFEALLDPSSGVATLRPTFEDSSSARDAVTGEHVKLHLTDPDSSAVVPRSAPRFGGDFVLVSQGDQRLVFARRLSPKPEDLRRLLLRRFDDRAGIDDLRWSAGTGGRLLVVDNGTGTVYAVSGNFAADTAFASLDTVGVNADTTEVDVSTCIRAS
ncbi:MAG: hypothetical protein ACR2L9_09395 [Solirubrobacteraceae bacterium]